MSRIKAIKSSKPNRFGDNYIIFAGNVRLTQVARPVNQREVEKLTQSILRYAGMM